MKRILKWTGLVLGGLVRNFASWENSLPTRPIEFFVIDGHRTPTHPSAVPKFTNLRICPERLAFSTLVVLPPAQSPCGCVLLLG